MWTSEMGDDDLITFRERLCMSRPEDRTVLIVEDEVVGALYLRNLVERMGCRVVGVAAGGLQAVEMARLHAPRAVITDIFLQGEMDGIEAAALIKDICSAAVIYITGLPDQRTVARAARTKPVAYILKPVQEQELQVVVERIFNSQSGPSPPGNQERR